MASRFRPLPSLLLSVLLAAPAVAAWAVPSFSAPPPAFQGQKCQASEQQEVQQTSAAKPVSFERMQSPCRLEDAETQKGMRINSGQEDPAEIMRKVEEWDELNRHAPGAEQGPGQLHLHGSYTRGATPAQAGILDVTTTPVPEPTIYAMLLGGLGLIALRHRKARPAARR